MAYRPVQTKFWRDQWIISLPPLEKLLYLYLFTNDAAAICGLYELPEQVIQFETGLGLDFIREALAKFSQAGKLLYQDGVLWLFNMRRYNETGSPKLQAKMLSEFKEAPAGSVKVAFAKMHKIPYDEETIQYNTDTGVSIPYPQTRDTLSIPYPKGINGVSIPEAPNVAPAVALYSQITGNWPGTKVLPLIEAKMGDTPDAAALTFVYTRWVSRGYNPLNAEGILEWYQQKLDNPHWEPPKKGTKPEQAGASAWDGLEVAQTGGLVK